MSMKKWHLEQADYDQCPKCKEGTIDLFLGEHKGEDAQKYFCYKCGFIEIITLKEMEQKEYGNH
jgi:ribosomal protein S27AE